MKSMIKRIAWLTVAVAIVLAAVLTVTVGAEQPLPELSIDKFNLSLKDSIYLKYAVTAKNASNVKLLIWTAPQDEYVVGTQAETLTSTGTAGGMLVFDYTKLSAKKMADVVYARAYTEVEGATYYSDVRSYSILEYIYTKLGYIGNSPTTDADLKDLLELMLEYGAAAQKYQDYNLDRLATDKYYQVTVEGGLLADGTTSGLFKAGDTITLTAPATNSVGDKFSHWANSADEQVSTSAAATIEVGAKNEVYTAVYGVVEPEITEPTFVVNSVVANSDDETISVVISFLNNPGVASLKFSVEYDDLLTLQNVQFNPEFGAYITASKPYSNPQVISFVSPFENVSASGDLATLTFALADSIEEDTVCDIKIILDEKNIFDENFDDVKVDVINGTVTINK